MQETCAFRVLRSLDQRFKDASQERSFKESLEKQLLHNSLVLAGCFQFYAAVYLIPLLATVLSNADYPFKSEMSDPRTVHFSFYFAVIGFLVSFQCLAMVRLKTQRLRAFDFERLAMFAILFLLVGLPHAMPWTLASSLNKDPVLVWQIEPNCAASTTLSPTQALVYMDAVITLVSLLLPIRTVTICILPISSIFSYVVMLAYSGHLDANFVIMICMFAFFSFAGTWRLEQDRRRKWVAEEDLLKSLARVRTQDVELSESSLFANGMQRVAEVLCDFVIKLDADFRAWGGNGALESFCGFAVDGELFAELLNVTCRERFHALCKSAVEIHMPLCMPVTLQHRFGRREGQLLVLYTGGQTSPWLLGLRVDDAAGVPPSPHYEHEALQVPLPVVVGATAYSERDRSLLGSLDLSISTDPRQLSGPWRLAATADSEDGSFLGSLDFSVSEAPERRRRISSSWNSSVGTQTESMPSSEVGVATTMIWRQSAFHCTCCMKPPLPSVMRQPPRTAGRSSRRSSRSHRQRSARESSPEASESGCSRSSNSRSRNGSERQAMIGQCFENSEDDSKFEDC